MNNDYGRILREVEDNLIRDMLASSTGKIAEPIEFDPLEEHGCRGGGTETWLVPGGQEFWLIFNTEPKSFTWIEYCPYCGYRPPNLRWDWNNRTKTEPEYYGGSTPVNDAFLKLEDVE